MNVFSGKYPPALRRAISHAARLNDLLRRLEGDESHHGIVGRAGELRVVVRAAVAEWREQSRGDVETRDAIVGYLADVHRTASKTLGVGTKLECCRVDDALTEATAADALSMALSVALSAVASCPPAATEKRGWGDSTEALARFHAELTLVDEVARSLARRVPTFVATFDDLRALGLEGLLDAARRFDPARGVPFAQWARVRIRSTILDGVRSAGRQRNATAVAIVHADPTPAVSPETELGEAEERALLPALLATLPPAERRLLERYYFDGQSLAQAASALGLPTSTASRVHGRALDALRRQLRPSDTI